MSDDILKALGISDARAGEIVHMATSMITSQIKNPPEDKFDVESYLNEQIKEHVKQLNSVEEGIIYGVSLSETMNQITDRLMMAMLLS